MTIGYEVHNLQQVAHWEAEVAREGLKSQRQWIGTMYRILAVTENRRKRSQKPGKWKGVSRCSSGINLI